MPDDGYYKERPRPESVAALLQFLRSNKLVTSVEKLSPQIIAITRLSKSTIIAYLTNTYIVSLSDVEEITSSHDINAIVTMSSWNGYTGEAKLHAKEKKVGLFKFKEFLGAVYHDGKRFLDYTPPDPNKKKRFGRS